MGKNVGGNSWLDVVKKAFRSPTTKQEHEEEEEDDDKKKRGKRRWSFSKPPTYITTIQHNDANNISAAPNTEISATNPKSDAAESDKRHAIALAMATTAAAEAAVATAQAAVQVIRLARPTPSNIARKYYAAIVIQTTFRGYLARRALRALKGIVKLQALVRGHNVRNRAKMTLHCIQSLVRVQARVRDQRRRLSYQGSMESKFTESNNLRESHLATRKSINSREGSIIKDEWDGHQYTLEEIKAMLHLTKEAASKREKALPSAFSRRMWRSVKDQFLANEDVEEKPRCSDQAAMKQWERIGRNSCDQKVPIKTVENDTTQSYSYSAPDSQRSHNQHYHYQRPKPKSDPVCSPLHRTNRNLSVPSPITPFPSNAKPLQVHSASPRCLKEEKSFIMARRPTLGSSHYKMGELENAAASKKNYMAATASTKARIRSQSSPRQRPLTPERNKMGSAKKHLSFPATEQDTGIVMSDVELEQNLRSPSFKTIRRGPNAYCCCEDSLG